MLRRICLLVAVIGLGFGADARADKKVDWTPFLEAPGARTAPKRVTTTPVAKPAPKKAKATRAKATKQRPKAQAKVTRKPVRRR